MDVLVPVQRLRRLWHHTALLHLILSYTIMVLKSEFTGVMYKQVFWHENRGNISQQENSHTCHKRHKWDINNKPASAPPPTHQTITHRHFTLTRLTPTPQGPHATCVHASPLTVTTRLPATRLLFKHCSLPQRTVLSGHIRDQKATSVFTCSSGTLKCLWMSQHKWQHLHTTLICWSFTVHVYAAFGYVCCLQQQLPLSTHQYLHKIMNSLEYMISNIILIRWRPHQKLFVYKYFHVLASVSCTYGYYII